MFERHIETEDFLRIPLSANMYFINKYGQIEDSEKNEIETTSDTDNNPVAWLYLWEGWKHYKVAMLIMLTFKPVHIPSSYWPKLNVLFLDNDNKNISLLNLVWKFPIGLESKRYPGYAFIPGYSRYVINKKGEVIKFLNSKQIPYFINEKGYVVFSLSLDVGKGNTVGRHRLLCLTWLNYPVNVDKMHVNHINGIPGSDDLSNLEWVTPKQNLYHALRTGLKKDGKEIIVKNLATGEISSFYTEAQACEALNFYRGAIRNVTNIALKDRKPFNGYDIRLVREGQFWEEMLTEEHLDVLDSGKGKVGNEDPYALGLRDDARDVECKNVSTGEVVSYSSLAVCAKALGMCIPTIHHRANNKKQKLYPGGFLIKDKDDSVQWRDVSKEEINKVINSQIVSRNAKTGEIIEFSSIEECSKHFDIPHKKLYHMLSIPNQPIFTGYLQFQYKYMFRKWRDPIDLEDENIVATHGLAVLSRNVLTDEIVEYSSARECALALGLSEMTIATRLRKHSQMVFPGNLQFKRKYDSTPWRDVDDVKKELDRIGYPVVTHVRDIFTNEIKTFSSIEEASKSLNIPIHVLIKRKNRNDLFPYFNYNFNFGDNLEWPKYNGEDLLMFQKAIDDNIPFRGRGYKLTNFLTGEVFYYPRVKALAHMLNVTKGHVRDLARDENEFRQMWRLQYYFKNENV
jgi:hypothetical protein